MKIVGKIIKYKWLVLFLLIIITASAYLQNYLNKDSPSSANQKPVVSEVKKGTVTSVISASGTIQTANYLALTTSANGIVKKVYVTEGEKVTEGQKIMEITLDQEGERSLANAYSSYLKAKNTLESAKTSLYSLESALMQKEKAFDEEKEQNSYQTDDERYDYKIAENDYLTAKRQYELQKSSITQAEIALQSTYTEYRAYSPTITATADGTIANIVATEGTTIENSVTSDRSVQTIASIKQEGTPTASLNITELDISKVKVGQKTKITLSSISDKIFTGTVTGIDKIGTQSGGVANYPVIVKLDNDSEGVYPNMSVTADIIIESRENVLYVPTGAVTTGEEGKYVTVISDGTQQEVQVKTGISDTSNTEILEGLNEGDKVILNTLPTSGFTTTSSGTFNRENRIIMGGPSGM